MTNMKNTTTTTATNSARPRASRSRSESVSKRVLKVEGHTVEVHGRSALEMLGFKEPEVGKLLTQVIGDVLRRRNQIKNDLVDQLQVIATEEGMTVTEMAERVAVARPRLSSIMNRDFEKVSIDAVVDVFHRLGKKLTFAVVDQHSAKSPGRSIKPERAMAAGSGRGM